MTQRSLTFDTPTTCGWCLTELATSMLYTVPTCIVCATSTAKGRVSRWLSAVGSRQQGRQGKQGT